MEAPLASMRDAYPAAEKDLSAVRSRLIDAGLGCHKETVGLPDALGYQVVQRESFSVICEGKRVSKKGQFKEGHFLKGSDDKMFPLISFCVRTIQRNRITPQHLAQLLGGFTWFLAQPLGGFTWFMLINRPSLAILDEVYSFHNVHWSARFTELELWPSVACEVNCLLGMLPFMEASLSLRWGSVAYEVDAGPRRTAVLSSPAPASTLRILAQLAERGG